MDLVIFHASCPDGWTAAYIAKKKYPEAELLGRDHGLEPPYELVAGKDVLVVDFSWRTREQNDKLASLAKSFRIFDHHKTAEAVLAGAEYAAFDMNRSGAGLAWDYLFGFDSPFAHGHTNGPDAMFKAFGRPWFVDYVEDRDLWRFKLPNSQAVNDYIMTFEHTIEAWDRMIKVGVDYAATAGENVKLKVDQYVREASKQTQRGSLTVGDKTYSVNIVNIPYLNTSEVGNELSKTADIGLGWFERKDGMIQFSARSKNEIDVSAVAKVFNGGGHKNAAGWQLPLGKGREVIDTILGRL